MPAKVPWLSDSWPAMPVMSVTDSNTTDRARPWLKTPAQVIGIQVSIETKKATNNSHHAVRMMRSIFGTRIVAAMGGGGGSTVANGSRLESSERMPGRKISAPPITRKGNAGTTAELMIPFGGM